MGQKYADLMDRDEIVHELSSSNPQLQRRRSG
jgi:hypothetical protein